MTRFFLPGHGGPVDAAAQIHARAQGAQQNARALDRRKAEGGDRTIAEMVTQIYRDTDPRLHGAAALSVLAHLEDLVARGVVAADGDPSIDANYTLVEDGAR